MPTNLSRPIVFTGSSIIALWESLPQCFPGVTVLNTAVSGSHTRDICARLDELVIAHAPEIVCYYCGSNDINYMVPVPTIVGNIASTAEIVARQLGRVAFVFLSVIKAPQKMDRWELVDDVNTQVSRLATKMAWFRYIDINPVFFTGAGQPRMDFYEADQLHLTPAAYTALGAYVAPRVRAILSDAENNHQQCR